MRETLSIYNNNPGNLRPSKGMTYEGQIGVDDRGFAVFETPDYGRKALIGDIQAKMSQGRNTPESFIDKYAPGGKDQYGDENTEEQRDNYKIWLAHKLGLKSTGEAFPENSAEKLADAIAAFEGGSWQKKEEEPKEAQEEVKPEQGETVKPFAGSETKSEADKPFIGIAGGNIGLGVASAIETGKRVAPLLPNLLNTVSGQQINPSQPVSRMSLQRYLNSQIAPNLKLPLTELEKVTGGAKIRTMSEVQNALRAIQAVEEQKTTKPLVKMVPGRPGVFEETGRFTSHTIPGRPGVDLTPYETKAQGPIRSAVQRQLTTAGEVGRTVAPSLARIGGAGLGGASAAVHGYEAFELAKKIEAQRARGEEPSKEDLARLAAKGSAAVGGGLSMFPFGVTQIGGLALSAPELGFTLYDWLRERKRRTANEPRGGLESVDPMGNPLGVAP